MSTVKLKLSNRTKSRNIHNGTDEISDSQRPKNSESWEDINATLVPSSCGIKSHIKKQDSASVAASKPAKISEKPWTKVSYKTRKSKEKLSKSTKNQEQLGRKILFLRNLGQKKLEADLMLTLNRFLEQARAETYISFSRVRYASLSKIFRFFFLPRKQMQNSWFHSNQIFWFDQLNQ